MYGWIHAWKQEGWLLCVRETMVRCPGATSPPALSAHCNMLLGDTPRFPTPFWLCLAAHRHSWKRVCVHVMDNVHVHARARTLGSVLICVSLNYFYQFFFTMCCHMLKIQVGPCGFWFTKREFNIGRDLYSCRTAPLINKSKQYYYGKHLLLLFLFIYLL